MPWSKDRGCTGHFSPLKKIKNHPRPGQNSVLKIDWVRASFTIKLPKTRAKLNNHNRLDPLDRDCKSVSTNSN